MKTLVIISVFVSFAAAEFCSTSNDCFMESCPSGYMTKCLDQVCTCEKQVTGECSVSSDCEATHGRCENNDKHWYCNENRCCCGEPCPHSGEHYVCSTAEDCRTQFYRCDDNDKHWYCTNRHCHCGSPDGDLPGN